MNLCQERQQLHAAHHRRLVILSGDSTWQTSYLQSLFSNNEQVLWVNGSQQQSGKFRLDCDLIFETSQRLKYRLGQEIDSAILDVSLGLSANHLGILSGMIKASGLLVILTPPVDQWRSLDNPEDARFLNTPYQLQDAKKGFSVFLQANWNHQEVIWLKQAELKEQPYPSDTPCLNRPKTKITPSNFELTQDQDAALHKIRRVAFGHRKRPLVLSADRGRGKSSILGIAAIEILLAGKAHIVITASRVEQAEKVFEQATIWLKKFSNAVKINDKSKMRLTFQYHEQTKLIEFLAPDLLVTTPSEADMLMVDEAAFLPSPMLTELLKNHHRMVFSTTLHGYEGSGRGFEIRFKKTLSQLTPDWKNFHLQQPVRWAENDPLEKAINRALLLNCDLKLDLNPSLNSSTKLKQTPWQQHIQAISSEELLAAPKLLESVFSLLVQAHYQTSPDDLQQLLNAPNLRILVCQNPSDHSQAFGVLLAIEEGGLSVSENAGQLHGHLVPQLLKRFYGDAELLNLTSLRIMRIAVHPQRQQNGIGQNLIEALQQLTNPVDFLSASFGASDDLVPFWFKLGFAPCHLGIKRDKASGQYNLVVTRALSAKSHSALKTVQHAFSQQFPHLLMESLPLVSTNLCWQLIQALYTNKQTTVEPEVLIAVQAFAEKKRSYDAISYQLWRSSFSLHREFLKLPAINQAVWCDKVLKKQAWQAVATAHKLAGKKAVENNLIESCQMLLKRTEQFKSAK